MGKFIDLTGQRFGRLVAIERVENTKTNNVQWLCQCDCGNTAIIRGDYLRQKRIISCGCFKSDFLKLKFKQKDLTGKIFGKLTVTERTEKRYKNGAVIYKCKCECGSETEVIANDLVKGHTYSCGCVKSKGENKTSKLLRDANIPFETQKTFVDCVNPQTNIRLRFDFCINNEYLLEYDGIQHFVQDSGWVTKEKFDYIKEMDNLKNKYCKEHGIPLIRIPYTQYDNLCLEDLLIETSKYVI